MNILTVLPLATTAAADAAQEPSLLAGFGSLLMFVPIILIMYFMMIRPQKKREKEIQKMRNSLEVGDEVVTSGGIIGRVVSIREDMVVIETGSDRSKIRIKRWAIQENLTIHDTPAQ